MNKLRFLIPICMSAVLLLANAQVRADEDKHAEYARKLAEIMAYYEEEGLFQGTVLVAMDDEVLLRDGYGYADLRWGIRNEPETRIPIASLGKALTAAMVLQLAEEGRISLDDPLSEHLTTFRRDVGERITIDQMLGHTAGLPWPADDWPEEAFTRYYALDELVRQIEQVELKFEPGEQYSYCNSCYNLLAAMIEEVTGNEFETELKTRILKPAGMVNTGIVYRQPVIERLAAGYELVDGVLTNALPQDQSYAVGAGGLYSTVDDLYRWDRALYGGTLLEPESIELMFESGLGGAGYGWAIGAYVEVGTEDVRKLALGYGGTYGYASGIARLLPDRYFIVFLGNVRHVPQNRLMNDLWNTILGLDVDPREE